MARQIYRPKKEKGFYNKSILDLSMEAVRNEDYQVLNYIFSLQLKISDIYWNTNETKDKNFIPQNLHLMALLFKKEDLFRWLHKKYIGVGYRYKNYNHILKFYHLTGAEYSYNYDGSMGLIKSLCLFREYKDNILYFDKLQYKYEENNGSFENIYSFSTYESAIDENGIEQMSGFSKYIILESQGLLTKDLMKLIKSYITNEITLDYSDCTYHKETTDITKFCILK